MRIVDAIPLLLLLALAAHGPHTAAVEPVKLIVDTDIGGGGCNDVDDVVAVCISHALERRGEAELLAIVQNTAPLQCAGAISVLNTWYRREDLPIGAYDIATSGATLELEAPLPYVVELADHWPSAVKNSTQVPDAVTVYRQALAVQPARSVARSNVSPCQTSHLCLVFCMVGGCCRRQCGGDQPVPGYHRGRALRCALSSGVRGRRLRWEAGK
jgi:hypothetical protein